MSSDVVMGKTSSRFPSLMKRRAFLGCSAGALGSLALAHLIRSASSQTEVTAPVAARQASHSQAKSVICLFQHGGPSQMDLFDPKPLLAKYDGDAFPGEVETHNPKKMGGVLGSPFKFKKYGQSAMELSELLPHTAKIADELTLIRSMTTDSGEHEFALRMMHTGKQIPGRPVLGSWVVYGLGTDNENLPAYVVLADPEGPPLVGSQNWTSGFLPASYEGTPFRDPTNPILHLHRPSDVSAAARENQISYLQRLNQAHLQHNSGDPELEARIGSFELAARMQTSIPEVMDFRDETEETKRMYGLHDPVTSSYARRCLLARRLIERGVRFVQVFMKHQPWDTHRENNTVTPKLCAETDQPSAALVMDLKRRNLLDSTIVLWGGEFGRTPTSEDGDGRDHNRHGFSLWLAGGGFKRGYVHGKTDDFGYRAVEDVVRVPDLHATLLHALGIDHTQLTYPYAGRNDSLTDAEVTGARVIRQLLG